MDGVVVSFDADDDDVARTKTRDPCPCSRNGAVVVVVGRKSGEEEETMLMMIVVVVLTMMMIMMHGIGDAGVAEALLPLVLFDTVAVAGAYYYYCCY